MSTLIKGGTPMVAMLEKEVGVLLGYAFAALLGWSMANAPRHATAHA